MKAATENCSTCGEDTCDETCNENPASKSLIDIGPSCNIKDLKTKQEAEKWLKANFYPKLYSVNELETGYEMIFEDPTTDFFQTILYVFGEETKCCSAFTLALIVEPNKKYVHYQYYGSAEIKKEMKEVFTYLELIK